MGYLSDKMLERLRNAGTVPDGEYFMIVALLVASYSGITISSNATPVCLRTSQGRSDQDE